MAPHEASLSAGSVVFALPHIREAIFHHHCYELLRERNSQLDAIARPVGQEFWDSLAKQDGHVKAADYFARTRKALLQDTNFPQVLERLGLRLASYVDFLSTLPHDVRLWLSACSTLGSSRKWGGSGLSLPRLEAAPREALDEGAHEEPHSNPAEMLVCASVNYRHGMIAYRNKNNWTEAEGLKHLLRDQMGRIFVLQLLDPVDQPFWFDIAARRPEVLYSTVSPFYPIQEVIAYSQQLGGIIWRCPPHPLTPSLIPDSERDELRRILERACDLFGALATLEEWGISLNEGWSSDWDRWMSTLSGGCIVPAYLERTSGEKNPGKLAASSLYEEQLPPPPAMAWPWPPLCGRGGIAGLPWSQLTAYNDPRVPGPRFLIYGLADATCSDADFTPRNIGHLVPLELPTNRFHANLLSVTVELLDRFFPDHKQKIWVKLLQSSSTSDIYEEALRSGMYAAPPDSRQGHSGLFTFCANCVHNFEAPKDYGPGLSDVEVGALNCRKCRRFYTVSAMPEAVRLLLLRIVEPETRPDGSKVIMKAKEAHAVMKSVMKSEIPRLEAHYTAWVNEQKPVERMATAGPLAAGKISKDVSGSRWLMLEMLRGNLLDGKYRRPEQVALRDAMKAFHAQREKERLEREGKRARAEEASGEAARGGGASIVAKEVAGPAPSSGAAPEAAKRSAKGGSDGAKTAKKSKAG